MPRTDKSRIKSKKSLLFHACIFFAILSLFAILELSVIGIVLGLVASGGLYLYERKNREGFIGHYYYYVKTPTILSGNRREATL